MNKINDDLFEVDGWSFGRIKILKDGIFHYVNPDAKTATTTSAPLSLTEDLSLNHGGRISWPTRITEEGLPWVIFSPYYRDSDGHPEKSFEDIQEESKKYISEFSKEIEKYK